MKTDRGIPCIQKGYSKRLNRIDMAGDDLYAPLTRDEDLECGARQHSIFFGPLTFTGSNSRLITLDEANNISISFS